MKVRVFSKFTLLVLLMVFSSMVYSLPSFPKDKEVEYDLTSNWKVQGEQGKLLSVKKDGDWKKKILFKDKVKYLVAFVKYVAKVEFDAFIRNYDVHVVYILEQNEWIYDRNEIINSSDEQKKGAQTFSKDEIKEKIKILMEKQAQPFFDDLHKFQKMFGRKVEPIKGPVKVSKVLIAAPKTLGKSIEYLADIEFEDAGGNKLSFIDMKYTLSKKTADQKDWEEKFDGRLGRYMKK